MALQSCSLTTIDEYTDTRVRQFFYCCVHSLLRDRVLMSRCLAIRGEYNLPNFCLATREGTLIQTHRMIGGIYGYAVEMGSGAMVHIPSFVKIG
jgi:hypothetical protein